jgi:hypothetical protein
MKWKIENIQKNIQEKLRIETEFLDFKISLKFIL